jgi:hypothetical protein
MDYLGIDEIPKRHVPKRWTRDARDVLPEHLQVYQNDHASTRSFMYHHSSLYKKALEACQARQCHCRCVYENLTASLTVILWSCQLRREAMWRKQETGSMAWSTNVDLWSWETNNKQGQGVLRGHRIHASTQYAGVMDTRERHVRGLATLRNSLGRFQNAQTVGLLDIGRQLARSKLQ